MKKYFVLWLIPLFVTSPAVGGPVDVSTIPADAAFLVHVDVEAARGTTIAEYLLKDMSHHEAVLGKLAALAAMFRFDPVDDLHGVTLSGRDPETAALLVHGNLDAQRLLTLVQGKDGYRGEQVGQLMVHSWADQGVRTYGGIASSGQIVIGKARAAVLAQLTTLTQVGAALSDSNRYALDLPTGDEALVTMAANLPAMKTVAPKAKMLQSARFVHLTLAEAGGLMQVRVRLDVADAQAAQDLQAVAGGLLSLARLNREENPEMARLAQAARLDVDGTTVQLEMVVESAELINMVVRDRLD